MADDPENLEPEGAEDEEYSSDEYGEEEEYELSMLDLIRECTDSQALLYKNTESFRCLAQVQLSSSSLMKNLNYLFPPLEDPGIDDVFDYVEPDPVYDDIGVEKYTNLCKDMEIVPISRFYGLSQKQMRAICETLKINGYVEHLILQDNWLNLEMAEMLSGMLQENGTLERLNIRECRIGPAGAEKLNEALSLNQFLTELDLSYNSIGDQGLLSMKQGLSETPALRVLNISHNLLTEEACPTLEAIFLENKTITDLDLSWNGFYTAPGNKRFFKALTKNERIRWLNMAWNGISLKSATMPISRFIRKSVNLEHLDMSNNRIEGSSLRNLVSAVKKNHSLITFKVGNNPYGLDEAMVVANMLAGKGNDPIQFVDMENKYLPKQGVQVVNRIKNVGKTLKFAGYIGNHVIHGPDYTKMLFERVRYILQKPKKAKKRKDFAHFVLDLPEKPIQKADFEALLRKKKMKKLDKDLVGELENKFSTKKGVNGQEMARAYKEYYPDASLPPPKPKKAKKGKKGKGKGKKDAAEPPPDEGVPAEVSPPAEDAQEVPQEESAPPGTDIEEAQQKETKVTLQRSKSAIMFEVQEAEEEAVEGDRIEETPQEEGAEEKGKDDDMDRDRPHKRATVVVVPEEETIDESVEEVVEAVEGETTVEAVSSPDEEQPPEGEHNTQQPPE